MKRIGLIGCGIVTIKAHLPAIFNDPTQSIAEPGFVITAICGLEDDKVDYIKAKLPNVAVFSDYKELIASNICDCVLIATGEESHLEIADCALKNGLYALIEKPASVDSANILSFIESNKTNLDKVQIAFNKRFYPGFLKFKELKETEELSNIIGGNVFFLTQQGRIEGKAGILSNLIHLCDLVNWIFGKPIDIQAHFSKALNDDRSGKTISASILTDTGAVVSMLFTSSTNWNLPYHENIEILDDQNNKLSIKNSNEIIFSKFINKSKTLNYSFNQSNSIFWNIDSFGYKSQITHFSNLVRGIDKNPYPNLFDALNAQIMFEEIFKFDK